MRYYFDPVFLFESFSALDRGKNLKYPTSRSKLTTISPKLAGSPVSLSTTKLIPSGGDLIRSRTSFDTLARVRGGKFSIELILLVLLDRLYGRYNDEPRAMLLLPILDEDIVCCCCCCCCIDSSSMVVYYHHQEM
jgi:hypothetical protein